MATGIENTTQADKSAPAVSNFCTGSSFIGQFDEEGKMTGFGIYRYSNGTEYRGHFQSGVFHGRGMIINPGRFKLCGFFINGKCDDYQVYFGDGLEYENIFWNYCTHDDRRFWIETVRGISPVGETFLSMEKPPRRVPSGMFDSGQGIFDPKVDFILDADTGERLRFVCPDEKSNIMKTNRMNVDDFQRSVLQERNTRKVCPSTDSLVSENDYA